MAIRINCPACNTPNTIDDAKRGRKIPCRTCDEPISVPEATGSKKKCAKEEAVQEGRKAKVAVATSTKKNEENEQDDGRPAKKKKTRPAANGSSTLLLVGGTAVLLLFCLIGVGGTGAFFWLRAKPAAADMQDQHAKADIKKADGKDGNKTKVEDPGPKPEKPEANEKKKDPVVDPDKNPKNDPVIDPNGAKPLPDVQAGGIPAKTVKELKAATVYIKVQFRDAIGPLPATGSGFVHHVDGDNGYIVTNDHVVSPRFGQVRDGNPKLVFHSGTPNEKTVDAVIVASDPIRDLAILKVTGLKDLPRPIPMDFDREATETMPVYSLGFPFGKKLALNKGNHPAINITRGTVTSLRTDNKGEVFLVQIDAEINPGNSGGPIVDDKGYLVGVAVSKFVEARTVGFAIPTKPLAEMMQGKVARLNFDTIQVDKAKAQISVAAGLLDPLGKLESLAIYYRPFPPSSEKKGEVPDLPRPDKDGKVPLLKGATMVALKVDGSKGEGTFSLECGQADKLALIVQASYVNGEGKKIITPANITTIVIPKVIYADKLTRFDAIDKARGQPSKRFTHKMHVGKHYVIEMRGDAKEIDPWLILRDSAGNILAEDDDSGGFPNALIVYSPRKDDDYHISATVFKGDLLGPFTLRIREEAGLELGPKGFNKAGVLSATDPLDPFTTSPAQTFNLILKKGRLCTIDMKSKDFDPYLRLENMAGVNLKFEDIGGEGHSTLLFTPFVDGVYRAVASSYDYKTGAFDLKITEGKPPEQYAIGPGGLKLTASLTKTDPLDIEFGRATQFRCKIYEVKLKAGQKYQFDLTTAQFEPVLRIEDARGKELAFDRNSGGQRNSRINFSPAADGVFRVIVSHFDGRLGTFNLDVRTLAPAKDASNAPMRARGLRSVVVSRLTDESHHFARRL
jgi:S1-C subfamily serine protease